MGMAWKDAWYLDSYRLAQDGMPDNEIARTLGIPLPLWRLWVGKKKALREGLAKARAVQPGSSYADFKSFVYEKLPRRVRELWDELDAADQLPVQDGTKKKRRKKVLELIESGPVRWQQSLFLHALVKCNFIVSRACMKIGITPTEAHTWMEASAPFKKLVEGIIQFKKDFFESALIDLVRAGDSAATIFANRTLNKDRGYAQDQTIQVEQTVVHRHQVTLEELPVDAKRAILDVMRKKAVAQLEDKRDVVDAEIVEG